MILGKKAIMNAGLVAKIQIMDLLNTRCDV